MDVISISLPWPPSINLYWRRHGGCYFISEKGKEFRKNVIVASLDYRNYFLSHHRIKVRIEAFPPDKRKRDLDNILKALLDALQWAEVYPDDSQIDEIHIMRMPKKYNFITVYLECI